MSRIYSRDDKLQAAVAYVLSGSQVKAAESIGCTRQAIGHWQNIGDEVWLECLEKAREAYDADLPHKLSGAMERILGKMLDGLDEARAKDCATMFGILFDKRQVISNKPTSIPASAADMERRLKDIAERLESKTKPAKAA